MIDLLSTVYLGSSPGTETETPFIDSFEVIANDETYRLNTAQHIEIDEYGDAIITMKECEEIDGKELPFITDFQKIKIVTRANPDNWGFIGLAIKYNGNLFYLSERDLQKYVIHSFETVTE